MSKRIHDRIPFVETGFQWYPSFDPLGDLVANPNPSLALEQLGRTIDYLIRDAGWAPNRIHLFGFAQGGSLACELARRVYYEASSTGITTEPVSRRQLGSVVSVCGPLLSYATSTVDTCPTPVLVFHRPAVVSQQESGGVVSIADMRRAFSTVVDVCRAGADGISMPRSRDEWEPIMAFWADRLVRVQRVPEGFEEVGGLG